MKMMSMIFMSTTMSSILLLILLLAHQKWNSNKMETSNFECGFIKKQTTAVPFSTKFFSVGVLFMIFDLEISLFLPIFFPESISTSSFMSSCILMMVLTTALILEWKKGLIQWAK